MPLGPPVASASALARATASSSPSRAACSGMVMPSTRAIMRKCMGKLGIKSARNHDAVPRASTCSKRGRAEARSRVWGPTCVRGQRQRWAVRPPEQCPPGAAKDSERLPTSYVRWGPIRARCSLGGIPAAEQAALGQHFPLAHHWEARRLHVCVLWGGECAASLACSTGCRSCGLFSCRGPQVWTTPRLAGSGMSRGVRQFPKTSARPRLALARCAQWTGRCCRHCAHWTGILPLARWPDPS